MILAVFRFRIRMVLGLMDPVRNLFGRIQLRILPSTSEKMKKTLDLYFVL
jgi:hypothetical protein